MIIDREMALIYETLYENGELRSETLIEKGISRYRIGVLIENGILRGNWSEPFELEKICEYERYAHIRNNQNEGEHILIMTEDEQRVYDCLLANDKLTAKLLGEIGVDSWNIRKLVSDKILKKDERLIGTYHLGDEAKFENYAKEALNNPAVTSDANIKAFLPDLLAIYDLLLTGKELSKKTLKSAKLDSSRVEALQKAGLLLEENGTYTVTEFRTLYIYANSLIKKGDLDRAKAYFELCYRLDVNRTILLPVLENLLLERYALALKHLEFLKTAEGTSYTRDYDFYLYVLSFLMELPSDLVKRTKKLDTEDILVQNDNAPHTEMTNRIRTLIFEQKFKKAVSLTNETFEEEIPRELAILRRASSLIAVEQDDFKESLIYNIERKNITRVAALIQRESTRHKLKKMYIYYLLIARDILDMYMTRVIPPCTFPKSDNIYELIKTKNYDIALLRNLELAEKRQIPIQKNHLGILLSIAADMMRRIETGDGSLNPQSHSQRPASHP